MATEVDQALLRLRIDGWCVLEAVIPRDQVSSVRESVAATVASQTKPDAPQGIGFVSGLINWNQSFAPYLTDQRMMAIAHHLLGGQFRISFTSAIINLPDNPRGGWHADWPFNQTSAGHVPAPYPDVVMHLTTLWMLSSFEEQNGGTFVVSGSHRANTNPTCEMGVDPKAPYPTERQATGKAGDVLILDSRLWHATAPNRSGHQRVAMAVRYAPWWLNLDVLRPDSADRVRMMAETGLDENLVPAVRHNVFKSLPRDVQPLFAHWVEA